MASDAELAAPTLTSRAPADAGRPPGGPARWLAPGLLVVAAGAVRWVRLDVPPRLYFDEVYYVSDALALLAHGAEPGFTVHPPLGKWLIAAGVAAFGDGPVGWRAAAAVAGTLTVLVTYLVALRLVRRRWVAMLAALLVAVDGLAFTMSRIAMLDGFVALGTVTACWLLLVDRDRWWLRSGAGGGWRASVWRRLAAVVLGLTVAVKWSGLLALAAAGLVVVAGELARRRHVTGRWWAGWPSLAGQLTVAFVALPALVYLASHAGWFASYPETRPGAQRCPAGEPCDVPATIRLADWAGEQAEIWRFHTELAEQHPYHSPAATWPLLHRPVAYAYDACPPGDGEAGERGERGDACGVPEGRVRHVLGLGNPVLWWLTLALALPVLAWRGLARRDWRAGVIAAFLLVPYLPWLAQSRTAFLFYMTPVVPFMAVALAYATWRLAGRRWWLPLLIVVAAVAAFAYWYPVLAGVPLPEEAWRHRMWFESWI